MRKKHKLTFIENQVPVTGFTFLHFILSLLLLVKIPNVWVFFMRCIEKLRLREHCLISQLTLFSVPLRRGIACQQRQPAEIGRAHV